jgi:hypothetical protein
MVIPMQPAPDPAVLVEALTEVNRLIRASKLDSLLVPWEQLSRRFQEPTFLVAVAGEFSRGKSTLLNNLLDAQVLPVGDLPTTVLLTSIRFGPEPALWQVGPSQLRRRLVLAEESWEAIQAGDSPEDVLEIELPHPWLRQTGFQLLDTPGAGDLTGARTAATIQALAGADVVLVAVSATMPLSLTERAFVEEHILSRKIPRVAVVLTRLDQVSAADRMGVIDHVRASLARWAPQARFWCAQGRPILPEGVTLEAAGAEQIRECLEKWAGDSAHPQLRLVQVGNQLLHLLQEIRQCLAARQQVLAGDEKERQQAGERLEQDLSRAGLDWEDLRLELDRREQGHAGWFEGALRQIREPLLADLTHRLNHAGHPREWWQNDLPYLLRRQFVKTAAALTEELAGKLEQDRKWLRRQSQRLFSCRLPMASGDGLNLTFPAENALPEGSDLSDLNWLRNTIRIGSATATVVAGVLFSFPGAVAGAVGQVVAEHWLRIRADQQRQVLLQKVESALDGALAAGVELGIGQLRAEYRRLQEEVREQEVRWRNSRREALDNAPSPGGEDADGPAQLLGRAEALQATLVGSIKGEDR